jgi:1,4-dihydroxy-2-naphthoate octaprenyltransferase
VSLIIITQTKEMNRNTLSGWVELSGFPKFTTTLIPFLLGAVLAWHDGYDLDVPVLAVSLLAVFLLTDFCFVLNACSVYADLKQKGVDFHAEGASSLHSTAVSGRFNALTNGKISVQQAVKGAYLCVLAALPLSVLLWLPLNTGPLTMPLGLTGIIIAYSYSRGPRLSYHSLGEIALTVGVAWLTVFSGYYLQAHQVSWLPTVVALPWMIDAFKLKLTRELPDFEWDLLINRKNLTNRLGKELTAKLYLPLTLCSWAAFIPLLWLDVPYYSLLLLAFPMFYTAKSVILMHRGDWKTRDGLRAITKNAFTGMILIPVALIGIFLL